MAELPSSDDKPRKILVRGVNWLGDAVMTTPALLQLRKHYPDAKITLLTREKLADLWRGQPVIDTLLTIAADESPWKVGRRVRGEKYELSLVLPNSTRSALEAWWAGIPIRVGYSGRWRGLFLTKPVRHRAERVEMQKRSIGEVQRLIRRGGARQSWPASAHQVYEYLHLVQALGAPAAPIPPALTVRKEAVQAAVRKFGLDGPLPGARPLFALNPGAEYGPAKRWPVERFAAVAVEIYERTRCAWLLTGGKADLGATGQIEAALNSAEAPVINLAGKTSLGELMALLSLCKVVLTNDTGPMHVAAAICVPVVVPIGSTSPELTGPGLPGDSRHRVLTVPDVPCAPCFRRTCPIDFRCMNDLSVQQVRDAVLARVTARQKG